MFKQSVAAVIFNDAGKVLSVSRKDNPNDFGLPGGKVDPYETLCQATSREVLEETGLIVISAKPIYANICNVNYMTTTFLVDKWEGIVNTQEKGVVSWLDFKLICQTKHSSFADYNLDLYAYMLKNRFIT